jgi:molybdate transport system substrate-binding protein
MKRPWPWIASALLLAAASGFAQETEILVSAAASLTDVLTALAPAAEKAVGARILLNFGASGTLRKQVEEGAPADVFFSASSDDMDKLEGMGLILSGSRKSLLSNTLVLIGAADMQPAAGPAGSFRRPGSWPWAIPTPCRQADTRPRRWTASGSPRS